MTSKYVLEIPLFTRAEARDGRLRAEPEPVHFLAPATKEIVLAVPGEDYSDGPTWRAPSAARREARPRPLGRPKTPFPWDG